MSPETQIYQIKIALKGSKPPIWRRVQIPSDITLDKLHRIIQATMGWWDTHLHQFIVGETRYGVPDPDGWGFVEEIDETTVRLDQIVTGERFKFRYEYDFGDSWEHDLLVEKVMPMDLNQQYPVCVKGRRACPPEDVGGIWMYNYFIESIRNPEHPDYPGNDDFLDWVGDEFDSEGFDLNVINEALRNLLQDVDYAFS